MYSLCVLFHHSEKWQCTDFDCGFRMPFSIQYIVRAINIKRTDRDAQPKVNVTTMTIYFYPWRARVAQCWVVRATRLPPMWPWFKSEHLSGKCRWSLLLVLSFAVRGFFFSGALVFPFLQKPNSKFLFHQECGCAASKSSFSLSYIFVYLHWYTVNWIKRSSIYYLKE